MIASILPVALIVDQPDWLTPLERDRRDRLRCDDARAAYVAAHVLARIVAGRLLGEDPAWLVLRQRCEDCGGIDHGQPWILGHDIHISLSHTHGLVAAAAATDRCGIDVEVVGRPIPARALTSDERDWVAGRREPMRAATLLWTRKEALAKAGGLPLATALATDVRGERQGEWQGAGHIASWRTCPAP